MIIDFHTHVFPEPIAAKTIAKLETASGVLANTDGCLSGLLQSSKEAGIDYSVILPVVTKPDQFETINHYALLINNKYQDEGVISFGGVHPDCDNYEEQLELLKKLGFCGIKLHPAYQRVFFNDIRYKRIISKAAELDMAIVVHAGIDIGLPEPIYCDPQMAAQVIEETQAPKLILAHMGGWKLWDEVEEFVVGKEVFLDMAFIHDYMPKEQFCRIVQRHGADKILFGTDSPWANQKEVVEWLRDLALPNEDKEKIYGRNAMNLLGIR